MEMHPQGCQFLLSFIIFKDLKDLFLSASPSFAMVMGPCPYGMAQLQVTNGGDSLQL
jgi:hypothetical protein